MRNEFAKFQSQQGRSYKSQAEYEKRYDAFKRSYETVQRANAERLNENSAFYKLNQFSDWTP